MGQSGVSFIGENCSRIDTAHTKSMPDISVFFTKIGWMGLVGRGKVVDQLVFGHSSAEEVWQRLSEELAWDFAENDWHPELRSRLESYAEGEITDFSDIEVDLAGLTTFQKRVVAELRKVKYGETLSYGELAGRAGSPKAARAVGSVMSQNRVPLVIPCHRVVASSGHLGGFSAPQGVALKKQLLAMESRAVPVQPN